MVEFAETWMLEEVIKRGVDAFKHYSKVYNKPPICKTDKNYLNCIYQKSSFAYEDTIDKYRKYYVPSRYAFIDQRDLYLKKEK